MGAVRSAQCRSPHANQPLSRTCATAKYSCVTVAYSRKTRVVYKGAEVQEVALALRGCAGGQGQREAFVRGQAGSTSATVGSPAHTVPGRLAVEHPCLTHKKDRRGRQAGPKSPIPLSSPSPRHPWDCPNLPVPSRVAGRTQHSSPTGNEREDSKGVVSTATTTSRKVSELSPPTRSAAESAGQADER